MWNLFQYLEKIIDKIYRKGDAKVNKKETLIFKWKSIILRSYFTTHLFNPDSMHMFSDSTSMFLKFVLPLKQKKFPCSL